MAERLKAPERENRELRQVNGIFRKASASIMSLEAMASFIGAHRGLHGGEPICSVLPIAPSFDHSHPSPRALVRFRRGGIRDARMGDRFCNRRLPEPIGNLPPAEAEASIDAALETEPMAA